MTKTANRNYDCRLEPKYLSQQAAVRRVCNELGLTCYKPDYHAKTTDCNTLLIYKNADHDYNMELDRIGANYSDYRPYVACLQNTDVNGNFSLDFMNRGKIDLRVIDTMKAIREYLKSILKDGWKEHDKNRIIYPKQHTPARKRLYLLSCYH